jgi:hypothetical protein
VAAYTGSVLVDVCVYAALFGSKLVVAEAAATVVVVVVVAVVVYF